MRHFTIVTWRGDDAMYTMGVTYQPAMGAGLLSDVLRMQFVHPRLTESEAKQLAALVRNPYASIESIVQAHLVDALAPCGHADCRMSLGNGLEMARACAVARRSLASSEDRLRLLRTAYRS